MAIFADRTVHTRLMGAIKARIAKAQQDYEAACKAHDDECEAKKSAAEVARDQNKADSADTLVNGILGKIL